MANVLNYNPFVPRTALFFFDSLIAGTFASVICEAQKKVLTSSLLLVFFLPKSIYFKFGTAKKLILPFDSGSSHCRWQLNRDIVLCQDTTCPRSSRKQTPSSRRRAAKRNCRVMLGQPQQHPWVLGFTWQVRSGLVAVGYGIILVSFVLLF